jgi:D-glycero-alpha-D-manno-heptose 1-phosphate guanylyltransferase
MMLNNIDVVILCGGMGKRLQSVINDRPKPMAQIGDRSFLDILIEYIAGFGLRRFILCAGYKADFISNYYKDKYHDLEIVISIESEPLGTAGAIKNAQKHIKSDVFLALNGDSFCEVDLREFAKFHINKNAFISMVLVDIDDISDCGSVEINKDMRIISFIEKLLTVKSGLVNGGIYFFNKDILKCIPKGITYSIEYEIFPKVLDNGIYGYISTGKFIDIGTPQRYTQARDYFTKERI